jgi:hypothetical protein
MKTRKQMKYKECGVFVVWYMVERLKGFTMLQLSKRDISDKDCSELRNVYWKLVSNE